MRLNKAVNPTFSFFQICVIVSIIAHLVAVYFSIGFIHLDEHYQLLEFASYKMGKTPGNELAWEFEAQIRPTLQPYLAYFVVTSLKFFGIVNPMSHSVFLRLISFLFSFWCAIKLYQLFDHKIQSKVLKKVFIVLSFLLWYLPFLHVRFSAENWSANCLGLMVYYALKDTEISPVNFLKIVLFTGLSFVFKFQSAVIFAPFFLWLVINKRISIKHFLLMVLGVLFVIALLGVGVDYLFYGEFVVSFWRYFETNLLEGKAAEFGILPWWYYFHAVFHRSFPVIGLLTILSLIYFSAFKPKHYLVWLLLPYVLVHIYIGHKELRFLYPLVPFVPFLIVRFLEHITILTKYRSPANVFRFFLWVLIATNLLLLPIGALRPAYTATKVFEYTNANFDKKVNIHYFSGNYFACPHWYFYANQNVEFVEKNYYSDQDRNSLASFGAQDVLVSDFVLEQELLDKTGLKQVHQTHPDWFKKSFAKKLLRLDRIWYIYKRDL